MNKRANTRNNAARSTIRIGTLLENMQYERKLNGAKVDLVSALQVVLAHNSTAPIELRVPAVLLDELKEYAAEKFGLVTVFSDGYRKNEIVDVKFYLDGAYNED